MSELSRAQTIIALLAVSAVVIITLYVTSQIDSSEQNGAVVADVAPTAVPILNSPRQDWQTIASSVRGAAETTSPVPCPFIDERVRQPNNFLSLSPALTFVCSEPGVQARPIASGRVVMKVQQTPLNNFKAELIADGNDGPWLRALAYGPFVAIDHGPLNGTANVTTVYAGLDSLAPELRVGQLVDPSTDLGLLGARRINDELVNGILAFELVTDDTRFGSDPLRDAPVSAAQSSDLASRLASAITIPAPTCSLPFNNTDFLVGAPRDYRSGTHNGLDFNCVSTDNDIIAAADGQVIFVVDDYVDATPADRDAVLRNAGDAVDTPFWTLAMLYGNVVVMDHDIDGVDGHIVTIYAHLNEVDEDIQVGQLISQGTVLGSAGNRGTSTAAAGIFDNDSSVHLHWELHVDDRPVGYLQDPLATAPLYARMLCGADFAADQPAC